MIEKDKYFYTRGLILFSYNTLIIFTLEALSYLVIIHRSFIFSLSHLSHLTL